MSMSQGPAMTTKPPPMIGKAVMALVLTAMVGVAATPARADDDDWRRRERIEHRWHARDEWREHHRRPVYVAPPPAYVYAPPPVVYAPPPPPYGINLIFPLNIR